MDHYPISLLKGLTTKSLNLLSSVSLYGQNRRKQLYKSELRWDGPNRLRQAVNHLQASLRDDVSSSAVEMGTVEGEVEASVAGDRVDLSGGPQ